MEEQPSPIPQPTNIVRLRPAPSPGPEVAQVVEQAARVSIGLASLTIAALTEAVARTLGRTLEDEEAVHDEEPKPVAGVPLVAGAAIGFGLDAIRWGSRAVGAVGRSVLPLASFAGSPGFVRRRLDDAEQRLASLNTRWTSTRPGDEEAATSFLRALLPEIVHAALDQIDLTELVLRRVDLDRVVAGVDLDAAVERVDIPRVLDRLDLNAVVDRIDLDAVLDRVNLDAAIARVDLNRVLDRVDVDNIVERLDIGAVLERVDLNAIASRIDVDAVAARIDLDAIVQRIDVVGIVREVIDEIDLPGIIRASTGTMATETVEGIRVQGMSADRVVARLVDRAIRRRRERNLDLPEPGPEEDRP